MEKSVAQYQKAFNTIVEKLKNNSSVLAAMVFGSMVSGDLWDESDIDFFVITGEDMPGIKNIYIDEKEIPIHIKLMSKEKFLLLHEDDLRGGFIHRIFASSRLVFSKDRDITSRYDNGRYYPDLDRERWNLVYLGNVIRSISGCKKYLHNGNMYSAYCTAIKCAEDFAKLYVNSSGYMISKDAIGMAMNLDDNFKECVEKLFLNKENMEEVILYTLNFLEKSTDGILKNSTSLLIDYMRNKDCFLSTEEIKKDTLFEDFQIDFEDILNKLWNKNMIKREKRDYKLSNNNVLFKENVYFI